MEHDPDWGGGRGLLRALNDRQQLRHVLGPVAPVRQVNAAHDVTLRKT